MDHPPSSLLPPPPPPPPPPSSLPAANPRRRPTPNFEGGHPGGPGGAQQSFSSLFVFLLFLYIINSGGSDIEGPIGVGGGITGGGGGDELSPGQVRLNRALHRNESFAGYLSGNSSSGFVIPSPAPHELFETLLPSFGSLKSTSKLYPRNITGYLHHATSWTLNMSDPTNIPPSNTNRSRTFFDLLAGVNVSSKVFHPIDTSFIKVGNQTAVRNDTEIGINTTEFASLIDKPVSAGDADGVHNVLARSLAKRLSSPGAFERNETDVEALLGTFPWWGTNPDFYFSEPVVTKREPTGIGKLSFMFKEGWWGRERNLRSKTIPSSQTEEWSAIKGSVDFNLNGDTQTFQLQGIHHIPNGTVYLLGAHNKSAIDLRALPFFFDPIDQPGAFNQTARFVSRALNESAEIAKAEFERGSFGDVDDYLASSPSTTCNLQFVLQLKPLSDEITSLDLDRVEQELFEPTGLPTKMIPIELVQAAWVSWECAIGGFVEGGRGIRAEDFWRSGTIYAFISFLIQLGLVWLLVKQMERSRTPSALSNVALWTIVAQVILDSWSCVGHVLVGIGLDNQTSLPLIAAGLVSGLGFFMFGVGYCVSISLSQSPEAPRPTPIPNPPRPPVPVPASTATTTAALTSTDNTDEVMPGALPLPESTAEETTTAVTTVPTRPTATTPPRPIVMRPMYNEPAPNPIMFFTLLIILLLQTNLLPNVFPHILFVLYLFWIPQIIRNVKRGTRYAFGWDYLIGVSVGRMWFLGYHWGDLLGEDNIFFFEKNDMFHYIAISQIIQIAFLMGQDVFGPTFFLPASYAPPPPYDYHPLLPSAADIESGLLDTVSDWAKTDCAICMEPIIGSEDEIRAARSMAGKSTVWAVAPCHHVFHTSCLQTWMAIRTVCPQCRGPLPPF
ncbi:Predicted E3 ubiquitin ligase [Phaffia rhodozyma]|uniref:RING-type E3 ubiquitin transferase n=1 Tax=Phaffia rhodozyma TaxID=264483 RepID=A0A0F7SLF9_PHARH|nr:Predicted E3 ubiquitin ligase [Phaffia rhodozyma]